MAEEQADLLILGSHGHGALERLALGSVSFHQVVATPHNVLVVRADCLQTTDREAPGLYKRLHISR